jgi:hypothetical protein
MCMCMRPSVYVYVCVYVFMHQIEIDELMREADVDGDGRISQLDFISVLTL